jgi:hypothetical protein
VEFLNIFFSSGHFLPNGYCYSWNSRSIWLSCIRLIDSVGLPVNRDYSGNRCPQGTRPTQQLDVHMFRRTHCGEWRKPRSRSILEGHGGKLGLIPNEEQGATCKVALPACA